MMRGAWLTWRIHRFETLFVLVAAALLGVAAWVIASQVSGIGLTESCWPRTEDGDFATRACDEMMQTFWGVAGGQTGFVRVALAAAPMVLGVILGVPIVARELELRTAAFSWALTPSRMQWLLARFLPMLLAGVVGLVVLAWAGTTLFDALWLGRLGPDLTEISAQGLPLVARGLAAIAVALLVGSLVARTMPALVVAVVVMVIWSLVVVPAGQGVLAGERGVWRSQQDDSWRDGSPYLSYIDYGTFDPAVPGIGDEPGGRVDQEEVFQAAQDEAVATCGEMPDDETGESPEWRTWSDCADPIYERAQAVAVDWYKAVPRSAWGDFVLLDVGMSALLGGAALLLTFPVVARRRPE